MHSRNIISYSVGVWNTDHLLFTYNRKELSKEVAAKI